MSTLIPLEWLIIGQIASLLVILILIVLLIITCADARLDRARAKKTIIELETSLKQALHNQDYLRRENARHRSQLHL